MKNDWRKIKRVFLEWWKCSVLWSEYWLLLIQFTKFIKEEYILLLGKLRYPFPHLVQGMASLRYLEKQNFPWLAWKNEWFLFARNKTPISLNPGKLCITKLPFPLSKSWKKSSQGLNRAKNKASAQSFRSTLQSGPIQHQAVCSSLVHCVWEHTWRWATPENARKQDKSPTTWELMKKDNSFVQETKHSLQWPWQLWPMICLGCDWQTSTFLASPGLYWVVDFMHLSSSVFIPFFTFYHLRLGGSSLFAWFFKAV